MYSASPGPIHNLYTNYVYAHEPWHSRLVKWSWPIYQFDLNLVGLLHYHSSNGQFYFFCCNGGPERPIISETPALPTLFQCCDLSWFPFMTQHRILRHGAYCRAWRFSVVESIYQFNSPYPLPLIFWDLKMGGGIGRGGGGEQSSGGIWGDLILNV